MTTDAFEQPRSRRSFLRNLGTAVAIGLGVTAVPASRAFASSDNPNSVAFYCCENTSKCKCCSGGGCHYWCYSGVCGYGFCSTECYSGNCFDVYEAGC